MTTARDLIQSAFEELKLYAPGETIADADAARGFAQLNSMLDSWSNESLTCYANLEQTFTLIPGISVYTLGPGGTGASVRPLSVRTGFGAAYIQDSNGNNYPVDVVEQPAWNLIGTRTVSSNIPDTMFYDPQFPLGIINIFPTPNIGYPIFFDSRLQLVDFVSLSTAMSLPPGYVEAFSRNLAIALEPFYEDANLSPRTVALASRALGNIKRTNMKKVVARFDPEIVSRAKGSYNIYTDRGG
jgi:hypothetical protein